MFLVGRRACALDHLIRPLQQCLDRSRAPSPSEVITSSNFVGLLAEDRRLGAFRICLCRRQHALRHREVHPVSHEAADSAYPEACIVGRRCLAVRGRGVVVKPQHRVRRTKSASACFSVIASNARSKSSAPVPRTCVSARWLGPRARTSPAWVVESLLAALHSRRAGRLGTVPFATPGACHICPGWAYGQPCGVPQAEQAATRLSAHRVASNTRRSDGLCGRAWRPEQQRSPRNNEVHVQPDSSAAKSGRRSTIPRPTPFDKEVPPRPNHAHASPRGNRDQIFAGSRLETLMNPMRDNLLRLLRLGWSGARVRRQ